MIKADQTHRGLVKGQCLARYPHSYPPSDCAYGRCGPELPAGNKRVELVPVPHICGFSGCTPVYGGPGNSLMPLRPGAD